MDMLGWIALAIIGTAVVIMCIGGLAWSGYDKYWSKEARRRKRRPSVADLVAKCQGGHE